MKSLKNIFLIPALILWSAESNVYAQQSPQWAVNPSAFEHFMTVTGTIVLSGSTIADSAYWVGVFSGDQCRGVARPVFTQGTWMVFLLTYGNTQGEQYHFKVFRSTNGQLYSVTEVMQFQISASIGQPASPFVLHAAPVTGIERSLQPLSYQMDQNYPNPFNPTTTITYAIPKSSYVSLKIYDIRGEQVAELVERYQQAGIYSADFDAAALASGVYLYRIQAGRFSETRKMILVK